MAEELKIDVVAICHCCGTTKTYLLPAAKVLAWRGGMLIQDAFPDMSVDDREFLISGTCPACWEQLFKEETDE